MITDKILEDLHKLIREFVDERDWDQFHTPKNLSMALSVEVAELQEHFQWTQTGRSEELRDTSLVEIKQEVADIMIYLILFADKMDINIVKAVREKIIINNEKYPATKVRGDSRKYDEY